jgi:hypothetical protein
MSSIQSVYPVIASAPFAEDPTHTKDDHASARLIGKPLGMNTQVLNYPGELGSFRYYTGNQIPIGTITAAQQYEIKDTSSKIKRASIIKHRLSFENNNYNAAISYFTVLKDSMNFIQIQIEFKINPQLMSAYLKFKMYPEKEPKIENLCQSFFYVRSANRIQAEVLLNIISEHNTIANYELALIRNLVSKGRLIVEEQPKGCCTIC